MISVSRHNYSSVAMAGYSIQNKIDTSIQRLSSGQRINAAKDDVAGVQISTRINAEIKGLEQASRNAADAQSLLDTAESAMQNSVSKLLRIKELSIRSANGTLNSNDIDAIKLEVTQNIYSIDSIASNTAWGGKKLLDGTLSNMQMQIGSNSTDTLTVSLNSISSTELGLSTTTTTTSSSSSSSHPGANNSTDISIIANHPTNSTNLYFIKFTDDTTAGMVHWYSNGGGIDPTDDPNSKVEILGKEYTVTQGTVAAKTANLQAQLAADGVSATVRDAGNPWGTLLEVDAATLNDYISAYGTNSFVFYADPLNVVDGSSNDGDLSSGGSVQLVSGSTTTSNSTANSAIDNTPQKVGSEFQVNTYTNGDQNSSPIPAQSVTALTNGDFVVAWDSDGQDGSGKGAFAQIFSSNGTKKGSEFQVNSGTQNNQEHPTVTALDDGGFIIAFMSYGQDGESSNYTNSYAQRYDASGATVGSQFILHNNSNQYQHMPVVTALDNGKFVATWQAQYTNQYKIYSRIFDTNNTPTGVEFMVNTSTSGMQHHADTVKLKNGDFVVSWVDTGQQSTGIYGQRFDSTGNKLGGEFQVNSYTVSDQQEPAVTALDDGGFVVSWQSNGQDGDGYGIFAQRYDASGNTVGSEFQVNTTTSNSQEFSTGVGLSDGGFLIAWTSNLQDGSGYGVFGQRFDQNGSSVGNEFQINSYTTNDQDRVSLAQLANGNVIATWDSNGQDGSGDGVFAQILDVSIDNSSNSNSSNTTGTTTNSSTIPTIENIDGAIEKLNSYRASLGALSNRLDNILAVNINTSINLSKANGLIKDANYAQETADLAKNNILQQTSIQMDVLSREASNSVRTLLNGDGFIYKQNFLY